jgi:hypothetical protein
MIGDLVRYAANRATHGVVEDVTRKAAWGGLAAVMLLVGLIFSVLMIFWWLEKNYGATAAGGIIAGVSIIAGLIFLMMPSMIERAKHKETALTPSEEMVTAVQEEMSEAVDYFGPIRVVGTAFVLGFGIARRIKSAT